MSHKTDLLDGIKEKVKTAPAPARRAFLARCSSRTAWELTYIYDSVKVTRSGEIKFSAAAPKSIKKTVTKAKAKDEEKDGFGFRKKEHDTGQ